jgi:AcrR family transcriptional regulator
MAKESAAKTRILEVASRLFYEQGYNSTGINQIIHESEIARASLYNHFPSKSELLLSYIERAENIWFEELEVFVGPVTDPKKKLLAFFDFRIARQIKSNYGGCQFTKIGAEIPKNNLEAFELIGHQKNRLKEYIAALLKEMQREEKLFSDERLLAEAIFLLFEGATINASISKNTDSLKEAKKIAETLLA